MSMLRTNPSRLTARQRQVLELVCAQMTNRRIAEVLGLSPNTVKSHVAHLMLIAGVSDRRELVTLMVRSGSPSG